MPQTDLFLSGVCAEHVLARLDAAGGYEVTSGKLAHPESSSALAVNAFSWFIERPALLPPLKISKHSKSDARGTKNLRAGHRDLRKSWFVEVATLADLMPFLFGYEGANELKISAILSTQPARP